MGRQHPAGGLAGARAVLEDFLCIDAPSGVRSLVLEALVVENLGVHEVEVALGVPVELPHELSIGSAGESP